MDLLTGPGKLARAAALLLALYALWPAVPARAQSYSDLKNHWARQEVENLSSKGVVSGYPDGTFKPAQGVSRGELAKLLILALNNEDDVWALENSPAAFRDVPGNHWAKPYIQLAYELGIVRGYDDGTFRPDQEVRRDELTAILVRALGNGEGQAASLPFKDAAAVPEWARPAVAQASRLGLISGYGDGTFRPESHATRAETASLLSHFLSERGDLYDFYGLLKSLDGQNNQLVISLNGQDRRFNFTGDLPVFRQGRLLSLEELPRLLPLPVYFNLDKEGRISFLDILSNIPANSIRLALEGTLPQQVAPTAPLRAAASGKVQTLEGRLMEPSPAQPPGTGGRQDPARSLEITRGEARVPQLADRTGASGQGVVIAIVDTGVDAGHPDLMKTPQGEPKILDWLDLSGEGKVATAGKLKAGQGQYLIDGKTYRLGNFPSKSGIYRYGFLEEAGANLDFNQDGLYDGRYLVVLSDEQVAGWYDTVYLDSQDDRDLSDERPLHLFRERHEVAGIATGLPGVTFNVVASSLDRSGNEVTLGFDGNGHGTGVAGVAAANGRLQGVAPGAQLLVVKVLDSRGQTDWERLEQGITTAARQGAKVINLSLGYYFDDTAGNNKLTQLVEKLSREGIIFTIASGNKGPGLSSLATPGNAISAISVGAYISPAMWKQDYGWDVPRETLWYFSSVGPRQDGVLAPTVIAPGSALTTAPAWAGRDYLLAEGTSNAAPHVAGVVAMLLESAHRSGLEPTPADIKQAIFAGARPISHLNPVEQGGGALDAFSAWDNLRRVPPVEPLRGVTYNRQLGVGLGLYARGFVPGRLDYQVTNQSQHPVQLFWTSSQPWMRSLLRESLIPAGMTRRIPVAYNLPPEPGLYVGLLQGDSPYTQGTELTLQATVVQPYLLTPGNQYRLEQSGSLEAGQYKRYFFLIPRGAESLEVSLEVPKDGEGRYRGRVRLHLFEPDGKERIMTEYAGLGPQGTVTRGRVSTRVDKPAAGVWEAVIYSSASLSDFQAATSDYRLAVQAGQVTLPPPGADWSSRWLVGLLPRELTPGQPAQLTLQVRDLVSKKPVDMALQANGLVYELRHGKVTLNINPASAPVTLDLRM